MRKHRAEDKADYPIVEGVLEKTPFGSFSSSFLSWHLTSRFSISLACQFSLLSTIYVLNPFWFSWYTRYFYSSFFGLLLYSSSPVTQFYSPNWYLPMDFSFWNSSFTAWPHWWNLVSKWQKAKTSEHRLHDYFQSAHITGRSSDFEVAFAHTFKFTFAFALEFSFSILLNQTSLDKCQI